MWKLKLSEDNDRRIKSLNNHVGSQFWEFDPNLGTPEERAKVEIIRNEFTKNRFQVKQSSDILMTLQVIYNLFFFSLIIISLFLTYS